MVDSISWSLISSRRPPPHFEDDDYVYYDYDVYDMPDYYDRKWKNIRGRNGYSSKSELFQYIYRTGYANPNQRIHLRLFLKQGLRRYWHIWQSSGWWGPGSTTISTPLSRSLQSSPPPPAMSRSCTHLFIQYLMHLRTVSLHGVVQSYLSWVSEKKNGSGRL